jgi:hypothetical protein
LHRCRAHCCANTAYAKLAAADMAGIESNSEEACTVNLACMLRRLVVGCWRHGSRMLPSKAAATAYTHASAAATTGVMQQPPACALRYAYLCAQQLVIQRHRRQASSSALHGCSATHRPRHRASKHRDCRQARLRHEKRTFKKIDLHAMSARTGSKRPAELPSQNATRVFLPGAFITSC